mmetsp:Transcript_19920/g.47123  ORF Transcript_19920/g.47123 Transcript_19920/m.47123 type:complete len:216 (-) Transcript_19920:492-1139(-)
MTPAAVPPTTLGILLGCSLFGLSSSSSRCRRIGGCTLLGRLRRSSSADATAIGAAIVLHRLIGSPSTSPAAPLLPSLLGIGGRKLALPRLENRADDRGGHVEALPRSLPQLLEGLPSIIIATVIVRPTALGAGCRGGGCCSHGRPACRGRGRGKLPPPQADAGGETGTAQVRTGTSRPSRRPGRRLLTQPLLLPPPHGLQTTTTSGRGTAIRHLR